MAPGQIGCHHLAFAGCMFSVVFHSSNWLHRFDLLLICNSTSFVVTISVDSYVMVYCLPFTCQCCLNIDTYKHIYIFQCEHKFSLKPWISNVVICNGDLLAVQICQRRIKSWTGLVHCLQKMHLLMWLHLHHGRFLDAKTVCHTWLLEAKVIVLLPVDCAINSPRLEYYMSMRLYIYMDHYVMDVGVPKQLSLTKSEWRK